MADVGITLDIPALDGMAYEIHQLTLAVRRLERKVGLAMATLEDFNEQLDATDAIIADLGQDNADALALLQSLEEQLANASGDLNADAEAALLARVTAQRQAIADAEAAADALTPDAPEA
jgi:hypothetical protein